MKSDDPQQAIATQGELRWVLEVTAQGGSNKLQRITTQGEGDTPQWAIIAQGKGDKS